MALAVDDAIEIIAEYLARPYSRGTGVANYDYDFYLTSFLTLYATEHMGVPTFGMPAEEPRVVAISPTFLDALWVLCRRGILRPSVAARNGQGTPNGIGYSLTEAGRIWLADKDRIVLPSDPSRFGAIFEKYTSLLGAAFLRRAQEAVKCHDTGAYLAACAMAGAAAEGALLQIAIAKKGNREEVLKAYLSRSGRRDITNMVLSGVTEPLVGQLRMLLDILSYWRDTAAHGTDQTYTEVEAYDALSRLMRLAMRVGEHWAELTGTQR